MKEKKRTNLIWTVLFWLAIASVVLGCCMPANLGSLTATTTTKASDSDKYDKKKSFESEKDDEKVSEESGEDAGTNEEKETKKQAETEAQDEPEDREEPGKTDEDQTEPEDTEAEPVDESEEETEQPESSEETAETSKVADPGLSYDDYIRMFKEGDYSYVTPSFKETMDSYEAFYDEYCTFMKNAMSGGNLMDMYEDYMAMVEKEMEMAEKIEAIDSDSMSTADAAYYSYVSLRISNKLLAIYS